jgi:serine/threonine protein kinase
MMQIFENIIPTGTLLKGKAYQYEIIKALGQGSFGITYLASTKMRGELGDITVYVAIKEFFMSDINGRDDLTVTASSKTGLFDKYKRKFIKETQNLQKLKHPNIVKILESFECNNTVYYVMEYIDGGSLDYYISQKKHLTEDETITITQQILDALEYMHSKNMLHLDLKPSNIMMRQGKPILIDFGLSKQYDDEGNPESSTTIGAGTPGYAPIEQSNYNRDFSDSNRLPVTMDIYALGATMFKMLTGTKPPVASIILNSGFPEQELVEKNISEKTRSFVKLLMRPLWINRPQSDAAVKSELKGLGNNQGPIHNSESSDAKPEPNDSGSTGTSTVSGNSQIEYYTFDMCINFLSNREKTDPLWRDVNAHYQRLLTKLQQEDDAAFNACASPEDYKNYIKRFRSINGAKKYQPLHLKEAFAFLRLRQSAMPSMFQRVCELVKLITRTHHALAIIFIALFIYASFIFLYVAVCIINDAPLSNSDWGGVFMTLFWALSTIMSIWHILMYKKSSISILLISSILSFTPILFERNDHIYEAFFTLSLISVFVTILLWGTLHIKKHGVSAWSLYTDEPQWLTYVRKTIIAIWIAGFALCGINGYL